MDYGPEDVDADVVALITCAGRAARDENIEGVISALTAAVTIYEEHPSQVPALSGRLADLLRIIRAARKVCKTLKRSIDTLRDLERRAEALRRPLH